MLYYVIYRFYMIADGNVLALSHPQWCRIYRMYIMSHSNDYLDNVILQDILLYYCKTTLLLDYYFETTQQHHGVFILYCRQDHMYCIISDAWSYILQTGSYILYTGVYRDVYEYRHDHTIYTVYCIRVYIVWSYI